MAGINSLIEFLVSNDWSFEDIKSFLERDDSSINKPGVFHQTPLFYVLGSSKCSRDIVRVLIQRGASIDCRDECGDTPLHFALKYCRDEAVIIELIEQAGEVNVLDKYGNSPLCLAFYRRLSKEVVESLLKAGCSLQACMQHDTVWQCFTEFSVEMFELGLSEDVTQNYSITRLSKLIIEAGADMNKVDSDGRSPLCRVLFIGGSVDDIKLLLSKGASFNDCRRHGSPMLCVTDGYSGATLKADVVELLLNEGASVEKVSEDKYTPLQLALRYCRYETAAIRILLNLADVDNNLTNIKHEMRGNLLHLAAGNRHCKLITVKFLLKQGVRCDEINDFGFTPLHEAIIYDLRDSRIIEFLVNNGSPINVKCKDGYTPLSAAVEDKLHCNVLCVLLEAGAFINGLTDLRGRSLLVQTLKQGCGIDRSKILLKWLLIENPSFNIKGLTDGYPGNQELIIFAEECVLDLQRMESVNVGHDLTLSEFIRGYSSQNGSNCERKLNIDLDLLLRAISMNRFLNFSDVISSKFSKLLLMEKLQQLAVYTLNIALTRVVCDNDCFWKIAKYLTRKDLLCLILAFYFTRDYPRNDAR